MPEMWYAGLDPMFFIACAVMLAIFAACVLIHRHFLRKHTKTWVRTNAQVLKYIDGGEGPDSLELEYEFEGETYRVETGALLFPETRSKWVGTSIFVLVDPHNPRRVANDLN